MQRQQGFTLIELLAVVVLVGVAAAVVMVSVGTAGHSQQLRSTARYLYNAMNAAIEEAVITQYQLGLHFTKESEIDGDFYRYTWLILDSSAQEWKEYSNEDFKAETLPSNIELRLQMDGDEVILGGGQESFFTLKQSGDSSKPALQPDIYFLSSGETPAFKLTLSDKDNESNAYIIKGNILGQVRLVQDDED